MVYYCDPIDTLGVIDKFFYFFGVISCGLFFSFLTTSYIYYSKKHNDNSEKQQEETDVDIKNEVVEEKYR